MNATRRLSRSMLNPPPISASGAETRAIAPVAGFMRNRWPAVFCSDWKYSPLAFHATTEGISSNPSVSERGVPPPAETTASRGIFANDSSLPIALEKTICRPSGDHSGLVSEPGCDTILFTSSPSSRSV